MSRPTFYVYFASKQEAFLAVAERSVQHLSQVLASLDAVPEGAADSVLTCWVERFFLYFDAFGPFATVWRLRRSPTPPFSSRVGKRSVAGQFESAVTSTRIRGTALSDPVSQGSALEAMLESLWFSSTMDDSRRGKQAALSTAIAMGEALIAR